MKKVMIINIKMNFGIYVCIYVNIYSQSFIHIDIISK